MHPSTMESVISKKYLQNHDRFFYGILIGFIFIACFTIFQDFLESNRQSYAFYLSESALFNTGWFVFVPCLLLLMKAINHIKLGFNIKTLGLLLGSILMHFVVLIFVFRLFSGLFFDGRYDINKILTYTLTNDLNIILVIYTCFIVICSLSLKKESKEKSSPTEKLECILVRHGNSNCVINVEDIYMFSASSPYIEIKLEQKKYMHSETLTSIHRQIDHNVFFRSHKSTIVNIDKVASYQSRLNGDYDILLKNGSQTRLSRTYVATFKELLSKKSQLKL